MLLLRIFSLCLVCFCFGAASDAISQTSPFVDAETLVPNLQLDIRYAGSHNFMGRVVTGYEAPRCLLTPAAGLALRKAQAFSSKMGYHIKVFDCYRPERAVKAFKVWAKNEGDLLTKSDFYPRIDKSDLFRLGYIANKSSHSRGSTVDVSLVEASTGKDVDMGSVFDLFDLRSQFNYRKISVDAKNNRFRLRSVMRLAGFVPYQTEWWHFTLRNEPFPRTGFDIPVR